MGEWEGDQNRQKSGERMDWRKGKVNKWEMPSDTHADNSTDPPSPCPDVLESERAAACVGGGLWEEHLNAPSSIQYLNSSG